jgi:hypothetical protein
LTAGLIEEGWRGRSDERWGKEEEKNRKRQVRDVFLSPPDRKSTKLVPEIRSLAKSRAKQASREQTNKYPACYDQRDVRGSPSYNVQGPAYFRWCHHAGHNPDACQPRFMMIFDVANGISAAFARA